MVSQNALQRCEMLSILHRHTPHSDVHQHVMRHPSQHATAHTLPLSCTGNAPAKKSAFVSWVRRMVGSGKMVVRVCVAKCYALLLRIDGSCVVVRAAAAQRQSLCHRPRWRARSA